MATCKTCEGRGFVIGEEPVRMDLRDGYVVTREIEGDCEDCKGTGESHEDLEEQEGSPNG